MGDFNGSNYKDKFIGDLVQFVASNKFQTKFEVFFVTYALEFGGEEEHKLIYFEIYQKFREMFESELDDFCQAQDITQSEFLRNCREAIDVEPKAKHYIDVLMSSVEFETFIKLMKIMRPVAQMRAGITSPKAEAKETPVGARAAADGKERGSPEKSSSAKTAITEPEDEDKEVEMDDLSDSKGTSYDAGAKGSK